MTGRTLRRAPAAFFLLAAVALQPSRAEAHCDTLDGPVVADARTALEKGDVTPVLKWVRQDDQSEIRAVFARAVAVRGKGPEARELADRYFFETLVRIHRASEGEPYEGLKPAGTEAGPAIRGSDESLAKGSVDELVKLVTEKAAAGIRERFERAAAKKRLAAGSVEAGRDYVAAYVEFMHYTERLYDDASSSAVHGHAAAHAEPAAHD